MMRPAPSAAMCGRTAHIVHHAPLTPETQERSNCASGMSASGARGPKLWALLTSTSTRPKRRTVSATIASTSACRPTSVGQANASPPAAVTSSTVRVPRCGFSSAMQTRAPAHAVVRRQAVVERLRVAAHPGDALARVAERAERLLVGAAGIVEERVDRADRLRHRHVGAQLLVGNAEGPRVLDLEHHVVRVAQ